MDIIIEFIIELFFEGIFEAGTNKKVPKWIRFPLLTIIILIYALLIIGLLLIGIEVLKEKNIIGFLLILGIDIFILIITILAFKKKLKENKK